MEATPAIQSAWSSHLRAIAYEKGELFIVALPIRAKDFSEDGIRWERIPGDINVLGSRYALAIKNLHLDNFDLALAKTKVAIGNSMGRIGSQYVAGRVDKACLEVSAEGVTQPDDEPVVHIGLVAEIVSPYAVFVRD
jgi:hypothetical protein